MHQSHQFNLGYALLALLLILLFQAWWAEHERVATIPYSEFEQLLADGQVDEVRIRDHFIDGRLKTPRADGGTRFVTTRVDPAMAAHLRQHAVRFTGVIESTVVRDLLSWLLPVVFFFALWMFLIRRLGEREGGLMAIGKSRAKVYVERSTGVTFADVAGVDEAKAELQEIVSFLREPRRYARLGARVPRGILLVGPPGTGKTLLARAVAGQAGVPFFSISGSEFVEMFVGIGAARVRDLFEQARRSAPAIIFIDELDALGRARGAGGAFGGHDEKEQTLNQLLSELDGFDPGTGIVLLAATNRPEILDPALLRAGRFDRQVLVDRPDRGGRRQILAVHVRHISAAADVDLDQVAALTPGFTGADLANLVNEAALLATRRDAAAVGLDDFTAAIERIVAGIEKHSRLLNAAERRIVAYHEMGHALVAASLPGMDPVHKVSIIPRGIGALGYTIQRPTEDRFLVTREQLRQRMAVLLGGRAAEALVFGDISTGAADDLDKVTEIARHMVMRYGMSDGVGQVVLDEARHPFLGGPADLPLVRSHGERTADAVDVAVRELIDGAYALARNLIDTNRARLDEGAALLLAQETCTAADLPWLAAGTPAVATEHDAATTHGVASPPRM